MAAIFCLTLKVRPRDLLPDRQTGRETVALAHGLRRHLAAALKRQPAGEPPARG